MLPGPILIVDDEPSNLAVLKQILGDSYTLAFARNGADGLAAARKHLPILVLLDVQMPDMDGYAVCRQLKSDPLTENTPVIFVSSMGEVGDEAAGFACGAVDYLTKPVSPAIVHARVRNQLSLVRAATLEHYVRQLELEQAKTARLSRIHAVLSGTNSAIVRIRQPQALLQEACRIAVAHGGFGLAWIGLAGPDGGIAQWASDGAGGAPPGAQGPAADVIGHILAGGGTALCDDAHGAVAFGQGCADARARGFQSLLGLPLHAPRGVIGAMLLYARASGSFDAEEQKLLGELAGDISFALEAIANEQRANFLSYYDALTGLPNMELFLDRLAQIEQSALHGGGGAFVIALNLERFKQVNDTVGRHGGDQVLRVVAKRLTEDLGRPCTVARVGADNFALAGERRLDENVSALCAALIKLVGEPIELEGGTVQLSARLGVAVYPADASDAESLFKNAEAALKQTKAVLARFQYYSQELNTRLAEKVDLERLLKEAVDAGQFAMHYQPKVDLCTGQIAGAEALIRWQHPQLGMVAPDRFIPLAEETGLIVPIGDWVIRAVCAQLARWRDDGQRIVPVALNLSALQFREGNVLQTIAASLKEHGLDPRWLEVELTETLVMYDPQAAQQTMRNFGDLGLRISLDDFGTGYSSLAYLKRFPFQYVKIDRAFVTDITQNPDDAAIATAIIAMAHSLRMGVIAEGVETEAQMQFLRSRRCDYLQGFYFSRPVPAAEFNAMVQEGRQLAPADAAATAVRTLLVVDDDEAFLSCIRRALRGEGYRILCAASAHQAMDLLAMEPVQVILCDQLVQKRDRKSVLATVARMYPETMRIVLSGYTELQSVLDAVNRGEIYRFLTKPWDEDILKQTIREAFLRHRPAPARE
ncbi:EAL domain-containing protein [Pseudoduganella namucuonensis]|uniref:Diguanylate cyclase (GGDEF) domain-containing protein n=1 Tax=Pseudoduganella namucuonensis TaxID=1035707 RepID=A0A1I7EX65_9BURK|nr:EAL domain-containing protein [Pseudoduganella namucuonensis]SFU28528.1 diguanylate cyclase (GGDEF) domain-containing protein [Pseudoduganella namucuonensis]